jgi:uncharacterized protein
MTGELIAKRNYTPAQEEALAKTKAFLKEKLSDECTGHDWYHIERVWRLACRIADSEEVDGFIVELGALLHDVADWKFTGDEKSGSRAAREWLESIGVEEPVIQHICEIVDNISYKGARVKEKMKSREGLVVQDADRLDSVGAVAIARTFAYGGWANRMIYDPTVPPEMHETFEQYKSSKGHSINHFYEKILLLKDRMNTATGRKIAEGRHRFVEEYLKQFFAEWNGED